MANSNSQKTETSESSRRVADNGDARLEQRLDAALGHLPAKSLIAVAASGGPDSSALAVCASHWCRRHGSSLTLFHVHHGLNDMASQWQDQAQALARLLDCGFNARQVIVQRDLGLGLEAAARKARRGALLEMAREQKVAAVLLAHHQQDQAETVLIRLMRGSGVTGLQAMATSSVHQGIEWLRPWLGLPRAPILAYLQRFSEQTGWQAVDDPSNLDLTYARGVLRREVAGALDGHWPAWRDALARHATQAAWADRLLERFGGQLLASIALTPEAFAPVLSLARWRLLDPDEQVLVLRVWLGQAGAKMPTQKRLDELVRQLRQVHALGHDRALTWQQSDCQVVCVRGELRVQVKLS